MNIPLIEKYRPQEFEDVVWTFDKEQITSLIESPMDMPNLLFYGAPGTGKTTVAKIILNKLGPIDFKKINGSDTTGIDTIREVVYNFMTAMSSQPNKPKIVWIEEFDYMSQNAFAALRAMIESYMKNARFIVTCNYMNKIPDAIQSRFTTFEFKKPSKELIFNRVKHIITQEKITVDDNILIKIIKKCNGDLRATINLIQKLSTNEYKIITETDLNTNIDIAQQIYTLINNFNWTVIRYEIPKKNLDYNTLIVELDEMFFNSDINVELKIEINDILAQGQVDMAVSFDKNICFSAIAARIIKILNRG